MLKHLALAAATILMCITASNFANAFVAWDSNDNVTWQGPGYYAFDSGAWYEGMFFGDDLTKTDVAAGAFDSQADCWAAISAHIKPKDRNDYNCQHASTAREFFAYAASGGGS